eukprot:TRINITY_DN316_c0_g1_i1.p2 TRINITY_DN316_c0_g1~~TRINITY_DN316_c0_g1_i1.p2  ORF type:complete len:105 (+),score=17.97 TRINITY_DN316_c0_g1_i1:538-852(+)
MPRRAFSTLLAVMRENPFEVSTGVSEGFSTAVSEEVSEEFRNGNLCCFMGNWIETDRYWRTFGVSNGNSAGSGREMQATAVEISAMAMATVFSVIPLREEIVYS